MSNRRVNAEFESLAIPLFASLFNLAHWLTQDRQEAEDLIQETYLKALKGFSSFRPGTNFRAWIYRLLRNTFLTSRTGLNTKMTDSLDIEETTTAVTPESLLLGRADQQLVQHALEQLSVPFREIILLCDMEEMTYSEISEALAIPIGTVMSRLSRARKSMRTLIAMQTKGGS